MAEDYFNGKKESYLQHARELLRCMEEGNDEEAGRLLDEITKLREQSLFQELGKLTRDFHEALQSFRLDSRIATLAEKDIPDARERLNYVISMTQQAADRTLTAIEDSVPLCEGLEQEAATLKEEWGRFTAREMEAAEFRDMARRLSDFLDKLPDDTGKIRGNLNEVLMAQDFQDLTGQIIKRVITLVDDLERSLVDLVRISGQNLFVPGQEKKEQQKDKEKVESADKTTDVGVHGPHVPGVEDEAGEVVSGQDEVDDLLSSLGF